MPLIDPSDLPDIVAPVLAGRLRLLMWGVYDGAALAEWQVILPIDGYLDSERCGQTYRGRTIMPPEALESLDPATIVVLFNYYYIRRFPDFAAWLDRLGIRYFTPTPLALACGVETGRDLALATGAAPADLATALLPPRPAIDRWDRLGELLALHRARTRGSDGEGNGIVLGLLRLEVGGAERQLCALATALTRRGMTATLATLWPSPPEARHYGQALAEAGVAIAQPRPSDPIERRHLALIADDPEVAFLLWHLPPHMAWQVSQFHGIFKALRPRAAVFYLDQPNVLGGLAAVLAGIPEVLLSGRNLNPTHFPHFFGRQCPDLFRLYRLLLACPGVTLTANSPEGARSYAEWLEPAPGSVGVIANAVADWAVAAEPRPAAPAAPPRVLGLFRLAPEKRPLDFVDTVARLLPAFPDLRATLCGDGSLRQAVAAHIEALGLSGRIELAGPVTDVATRLADATLLLHTAEAEGMPNVLLEAQAMGVPVISSRAAGSLGALAPVLHPFTAEIGDTAGLAAAAARLLGDRKDAVRLGHAAADYVRSHFTMEQLIDHTLAALHGR